MKVLGLGSASLILELDVGDAKNCREMLAIIAYPIVSYDVEGGASKPCFLLCGESTEDILPAGPLTACELGKLFRESTAAYVETCHHFSVDRPAQPVIFAGFHVFA